jgi:hypothetical protein
MSGCGFCGVDGLPSIVWNAHDNDDPAHKRTFPLCCNCHRLYDHGIIATAEINRAIADRARGSMCRDIGARYARIAAELAAGSRRVDKSIQHKAGTPERRKRALKAVRARRRNRLAKLRVAP